MFDTKQTDKQGSDNLYFATKHIPSNNRAETNQPNNIPGSRHLLQRNLGNSLVQTIFQADDGRKNNLSTTRGALSYSYFSSCCSGKNRVQRKVQPKLSIGVKNDIFEQEADRVAEQVTSMPEPPAPKLCPQYKRLNANGLTNRHNVRQRASNSIQKTQDDEEENYFSGSTTILDNPPSCRPAQTGISPGMSNCSIYQRNSWWLPLAYVNNATCACTSTPNSTTANCVRQFLQDRLTRTPSSIKSTAATQKIFEPNPMTYPLYQTFVQSFLTPRIIATM